MHSRESDRLEVVTNGVDVGLLGRGWTADALRAPWRIEVDRFVLCVARFDYGANIVLDKSEPVSEYFRDRSWYREQGEIS